ncbi:hypothetical protein ABTF87_01015 [Acinetobacter baumannii]|uniref:Uncharacterized protein n=7 Tax=Acinetobacter baumannii TaxID=470 RepID=A0AAX1IZW5_ACIBA|nr:MULTISPECIES: hypothetical protein [Acinetobacter]ACC58082.1 hypothetical protein ACICU_02770 [Acinetobacter baumannii ACICU]AFI94567.1 hypothetical protein ABTJ_00945 [Acinetobacter baumannii MDR-TJ]ALX98458.1 hypothetical protein KBNAB1_0888 [Acinetobacter baumannii]AMC16489.1 hypothetical protein AXA63_13435 [Acinetobacter baumannii]AML67990.1 hypothetical protein AYR68_13370 [Acinetobacter baumannii]
MNSAAEMKRITEIKTFEEYKSKVAQALKNDAFGLTVSQLMTICKLSAKTVKQVLDNLEVEKCGDTYTLVGMQSALQNTTPRIEVLKVNTKPNSFNPVEVSPVSPQPSLQEKDYSQMNDEEIRSLISLKRRITAVIIHHERLGLKQMMEISGATKEELLAEALSLSRKAMVKFVAKAGADFYESHKVDEESLPVANEDLPLKIEDLPLKIEDLPLKNEELPQKNECFAMTSNDANPKPQLINTFRSLVKKKQIIEKELFLDSDQLADLLQEIFGLNNITWDMRGRILMGVRLSSTEVI